MDGLNFGALSKLGTTRGYPIFSFPFFFLLNYVGPSRDRNDILYKTPYGEQFNMSVRYPTG